MTEEFFVSWKGETLGPFTRDEIDSRLRSGEITPLHAIRRNGELIDAARWLHSLRPAKPAIVPALPPEPPEPFTPPPPPPPPPFFSNSKPTEAVSQEFSDPYCVSNLSQNLPPPPPPPPPLLVPNPLPYVAVTTQNSQKHDVFAVLTFATAMVSIFILPIIFVPICYICSIISYYRLKDNPNLKGKGLRLAGAIIGAVSLLYLLWSLGIFKL